MDGSPAVTGAWTSGLDTSHLAGVQAAANVLNALQDGRPGREFTLDARTLLRLADANAMPVRPPQPAVLFALRGCQLSRPGVTAVEGSEVRLKLAVPDHIHNRCVIGIWLRRTGRLAVFSGSTVPNSVALHAQFIHGWAAGSDDPSFKANTLATGWHTFVAGRHSQLVSNTFRSEAIQPVFRVRRSTFPQAGDGFSLYNAHDNIHPAVTLYPRGGADFSSEGCLTVAESLTGDAESRRFVVPCGPDWFLTEPGRHHPVANWSRLKALAGLSVRRDENVKTPPPVPPLMLLTGIEAWLASGRRSPARRLRFGSVGDDVERLATALGIAGKAALDGDLYAAWLRRNTHSAIPVPIAS